MIITTLFSHNGLRDTKLYDAYRHGTEALFLLSDSGWKIDGVNLGNSIYLFVLLFGTSDNRTPLRAGSTESKVNNNNNNTAEVP